MAFYLPPHGGWFDAPRGYSRSLYPPQAAWYDDEVEEEEEPWSDW